MDANKLIELKQERAKLTTDIRAMMDKYADKEMDGADKDSIAGMEKRFDEVTDIIAREEKQLERERIAGEKEPDPENKPGKKDEVLAALRNYFITGNKSDMEVYNAVSQSSPTDGGYLIPPEQFMTELIREIADMTFMRQRCRVLEPLRGAKSMGFPTRTSAMSSGAWGTEVSEVPEATNAAYGKREFKPNPFTALIKVSKTFIRNFPSADSLIRADFAEYFAEEFETAYMTGDGANKPLGIFTASDDGIPTSRDVSTGNTATEIKFDGLIEAQMLVKSGYQSRAEWIFHRDAVKQMRKLKGNDGQYIWQPSVQIGQPDMLFNKPVNMSEYAPHTFTTGLYVGFYGDLQYYWILDSLAMEIQVLNELYARNNQNGYIGRFETDGAPIQSAAFARVKLA